MQTTGLAIDSAEANPVARHREKTCRHIFMELNPAGRSLTTPMNNHNKKLSHARERMNKVFSPNQLIGRTLTIGCTAVEITQRCNLDCTLCYLSENSEAVADLPIEEIFRRLDAIRASYGARANVQITGGDPTLRKHRELVEIVRYARKIGLFPALFTNGIAASRRLLVDLAEAGLCDVAFHVDTTQRRLGYDTERALNAVRDEYLRRASGLGLMVIFNTTIHDGNFAEIPDLVRYFIANAEHIGFVSFQLQADTGRGVWHQKDPLLSLASVRIEIDKTCDRELPWDVVRIGHPKCHSYVPMLVINRQIYPVIADETLFAELLAAYRGRYYDARLGKLRVAIGYLQELLKQPRFMAKVVLIAIGFLWRAKKDLFIARGKVQKLSLFVQNFMDAKALDPERLEACSFTVMTQDGPVSMCAHNAERDRYILKPVLVHKRDGSLVKFEPRKKAQRTVSRRDNVRHSVTV